MSIFLKTAKIAKILLILLIAQSVIVQGDGTLCNQVFNFDVYFSLIHMKLETYSRYTLLKNKASQGTFTHKVDGEFNPVLDDKNFPALGYDYLFNFCKKVTFQKVDPCYEKLDDFNTFGMTVKLNVDVQDPANKAVVKRYGEDCTKIEVNALTTDSKLEYFDFKLMNEDKPQEGFIYHLWQPKARDGKNDKGETITVNYNSSVTYFISCDSKEKSFNVSAWRYIRNDTYDGFFFEINSQDGCPTIQISKIWQILADNKIIFTFVMVVLGTALCFFGLKIYNPTLFIVGYITGFGGLVAIMGEFVIRYDTDSVVAYACLIIAVFFGVLTGYATVSQPRLGFFALGMWLGIVFALLLNNAFLYKIQIGNTSIVLWVTIAVLSVSLGLLSCFFYEYCVMVCTAFIGAYCLIRPFGWILGDFPNELEIAKQLKYGQLTKVPSLFYLYFALILLIGAIGIKFQYSMYYSRKKEEEENDIQLYLADPDFIDMNKALLDKDDEDLTQKQQDIKKKVISMQKSVAKEKKRQEKVLARAEKLRRREQGEEVSSDSEEGDNSDEEDEEGNRTHRRLFNAMADNQSRRKSKAKSYKKQNSGSSPDGRSEDDVEKTYNKNGNTKHHEDDTPDLVIEKKHRKLSNAFSSGSKKLVEKKQEPDIEMDDLSESNYVNYAHENDNKKNKQQSKKNSDNSESDEEEKQKKKNAAKLAKKHKKK